MRVLIVPGHNRWYAQCLELDVAAQGDNFTELRDRFISYFDLKFERYQKDKYSTDSAPGRYFTAYKSGDDFVTWTSQKNDETLEVRIVPNLDYLESFYERAH